MRQRYFLIEPKYSDPDTFCHFIVGSDRVRASIQIYADLRMLREVASGLTATSLAEEVPDIGEPVDEYGEFNFELTVLPHEGGRKRLRFRVFQEMLDDDAPYRADIRFDLSPEEAGDYARELEAWCVKPEYVFVWKAD